jgi:predicted metalloprotease with PDZ domain
MDTMTSPPNLKRSPLIVSLAALLLSAPFALAGPSILVGNQEVLRFEVRGVPHEFVGRDLGNLDRPRFVADLKAMVEAAATFFGELPYTHYVFLAIGPAGTAPRPWPSRASTRGAATSATTSIS